MKRLQSITLRLQVIVGLLVILLVAGSAILAVQAFERRQQADRVMADHRRHAQPVRGDAIAAA